MKSRIEKQKRITTTENWFPTAEDNKVSVTLIKCSTGKWHISIWGDDNFGLELDFPKDEHGYGENYNKALTLYNRIIDNTSQAQMRSWGMYPA